MHEYDSNWHAYCKKIIVFSIIREQHMDVLIQYTVLCNNLLSIEAIMICHVGI